MEHNYATLLEEESTMLNEASTSKVTYELYAENNTVLENIRSWGNMRVNLRVRVNFEFR